MAVTTKPQVQTATNAVDHPIHYNKHPSGVECITITRHMNFNIGNAMKYLWRAERKNGIEDLEKAVWYIKDEIKRLVETSPEGFEGYTTKIYISGLAKMTAEAPINLADEKPSIHPKRRRVKRG